MNLTVDITNCGKISNASVEIAPFTMIGGANSSGKSFITRSLYSIFNVISNNTLNDIGDEIVNRITRMVSSAELELLSPSKAVIEGYDTLIKQTEEFEKSLEFLLDDKSLSYSARMKFLTESIDSMRLVCDDILSTVKDINKYEEYKTSIEFVDFSLSNFYQLVVNPSKVFSNNIDGKLKEELKDNFQIVELSDLKNNNSTASETVRFIFEGYGHLEISKDKDLVYSRFDISKTKQLEEISNVVFLESPVYWKLRKTLVKSERSYMRRFIRQRAERLTGIPKYFLDLVDMVEAKYKPSEEDKEVRSLYHEIEALIGGELQILDSGDICFKEANSKKNININLTASGITNLGIISLLLKQNVIKKGSFIIIDEPEVNLHPAWQKVLVDILYKLSNLGVNIIIASHSVDMFKYVENIMEALPEDKVSKHFAVNHLSSEGKTINSEFSNYDKLTYIKDELNSSYVEMFMEGHW
ncbi:AAA family ATPase [Vibrio parahaemolyticus]